MSLQDVIGYGIVKANLISDESSSGVSPIHAMARHSLLQVDVPVVLAPSNEVHWRVNM